MSTEQGEIYKLIPKIMKAVGHVSKDRKNEQQHYSFRGIEDFYAAAQPALIEHGVFCTPRLLKREAYRFEKTNDQGRVTTWLHVDVEVEHRFYASDGSYVEVITPGEGLDNSDKATNKAMSAAMKYAYIELLCVPTKDVEDADRTTPEAGMQKTRVTVGEKPPALPKPNGKEPTKGIPEPQRNNFKVTFLRALTGAAKQVGADHYAAYLADKKINFDTMNPDDFYAIRDEAEEYARTL